MRYINDPVRGIIPSPDGKGMTRAQAMAHLKRELVGLGTAPVEVDNFVERMETAKALDAAIARGDQAEAQHLRDELDAYSS